MSLLLADLQHPPGINVMTAARKCALLAADAVFPLSVAATAYGQGRAEFDLPGIAKLSSQEPARLIVAPPLPDALARGLAVIQYRATNLRIVPVYGPAALSDTPRIGHLHVTIDDAPWHWLDASNEPLIIQGLTPGPHRVLIELADPTRRVIDSKTVSLEIPQRPIGQ
jgi:uncharacterized protein DUF6130